MGLRQHLAWGGETSGKEEVGRMAGQRPRGCAGSGEEDVTGLVFTGRMPGGCASIDALYWINRIPKAGGWEDSCGPGD